MSTRRKWPELIEGITTEGIAAVLIAGGLLMMMWGFWVWWQRPRHATGSTAREAPPSAAPG